MVLVFSTFPVICRSATNYTIQPLFEEDLPVIDGNLDEAWEDYREYWADRDYTVNEVITDFSDIAELYMLINPKTDWLYVGLQFNHQYVNISESNDTFAFFFSNQAPDSPNLTTDIWSYDDIKAVRVDEEKFDQYVDSGDAKIDSEDEITFAFNHTSTSAFFEFKFPLSTDSDEDINWTASNTYTLRILYGNEYESIFPFRPNYTTFTSTGKITVKLGFQPEDPGYEEGDPWWQLLGAGDLDTFVAKLIFFAIAISMFIFIGSYVLNSKRRLGRVT